MIDTGSDLNLIKQCSIDSQTWVNSSRIYNLIGISEEMIPTLGEIKTHINGIETSFQTVPNDFPISQSGILGMAFLKQQGAMFSVAGVNIHLGSRELPEISYTTICLPARTKKLVEIPLKENNLSEGYIRKLDAGPGVFLGETIVARSGGTARCFAINCTTSDVQLTLPPVDLEECTVVPPRARAGVHPPNSREGQQERAKRFALVLKILNLKDLNEQEEMKMYEVIGDYLYQFHLPGDKLGATTLTAHQITTTDEIPINIKNYRHPNALQGEIRKQVNELLAGGIVQESNSPYNSPLWIVPKKPDAQGNKRWRMVIDYRALNKKTVADAYPLPNITDIIDKLGGAKYFSVLDLASGFHQIPMDSRSRAKTAFSALFRKLEFNRMPFGLMNSPSTFQRLMDRLLCGLQGIELFVYMDDIVIFGTSLEDHDRKLRALLGRLKEAGLTLQPEKCFFLRKEITYLGHVISEDGVKLDPKKIQAVRNFPVPKRPKNIKQFLGLVGYYRRFIQDFANIAKPLNNLLKKGVPFHWTDTQQKAFETLRDKICNKPILQYPDFSKPFLITTDASDYALGAVLSQGPLGQDLPISFASRTLNPAECNYTTSEKELLAIVFAVQHFRPYVYGRKFTLVTDHRPLVWLHGLKDPVSRLARWKIKLSEYDYDIVYKPGKLNANADALSRNPCDKAKAEPNLLSQTVLLRPSVARILNCADHDMEDERDEHGGSLRNFVDNSVSIDNIIERVFLSRGVLHMTNKEKSAERKSDSEIKPSQVRQCETTQFRLPLVDVRDPVSARCAITRYGAQAVGMRHSNSGFDTLRKTDDRQPGKIIPVGQGPQVRDALRAQVPAQVSSGERRESAGVKSTKSRNLSTQVKGQGPPDSGIDKGSNDKDLAERERERAMRKSETELRSSSILVIVDSCLKYSKDKLLIGKGHIVNFISNDCALETPINKELTVAKLISSDNLQAQNPQVGETIVFGHNGRYIFNVVVKSKIDDRPSLNNISRGIKALTEAMIPLNVNCVKFSTVGNGLDDLSWSSIEQIIRQHFAGNGLRAYICSGDIILPKKDDHLKIIKEFHESTVGGHKGVSKTYWRIRSEYYWSNLKADVQKYVKHCRKCQENKLVRVKTKQPMLITDTPAAPFDKIQIDIVGPLPVTPRGNKYILTVQDNFSKYSDAIPISKIDSETIATALAEQFISRYGCPRSIHTDQGTNFTSNLMKTFCKIFNIQRITSTAFHPQSLGSLERSHHTLIEYLKQYGDQQNWDEWLRFAIFSYNTSIHEAIGYAPYTLVFGRKAQIPTSFSRDEAPKTYVQYLTDLLRKLHSIQSESYEKLKAAKEKSKKYYDLKANPEQFNVGDHVYLLKEPRQTKFDSYYTGPYILEERIGHRNAKIRLGPGKLKIVHVDKLKLAAFPCNE